MPVTNEFRVVPLSAILIDRDRRQRRDIDVTDILPSIRARGVLQPIIVEDLLDGTIRLVAGERRMEASRQAGLLEIPVRFAKDLSPTESQIIELEENIKRKDLPWQDLVQAVANIHALYLDLQPEWTMTETASAIGLTIGTVSLYLRVHGDLADPKIATSGTVREAYNLLARRDQRAAGNALEELIGITDDILGASPGEAAGAGAEGVEEGSGPAPNQGHLAEDGRVVAATWPESIHPLSFLDWAPQYTGQKFNLIHCDFPYGVELFGATDTRQVKKDETYGDAPSDYWALLGCFCSNLDRFMSLSAHLMFWYSENWRDETRDFLAQHAPSLAIQVHPLIWSKTDNAGLVTDVRRRPRHVYETCLLASRGDRHIVAPKADWYGSPTDKTLHPSTKPEPMLKHFMGMLVDQNTTMFDPTCGSGSSVRAAEALGATRVLGLEIDPKTCELAQQALRNARRLRQASESL